MLSEPAEPPEPAAETRCGFVSFVGRTNVGKSTLINALTEQKVTITSARTQTTQLPVRAILTEGPVQAVFVDTPGLHKPQDPFGRELLRRADSVAEHCDLLVAVVEPGDIYAGGTRVLVDRLLRWARPTILVINKVDRLKKGNPATRQTADAIGELVELELILPTSATDGAGVDVLRDELLSRMPPGPHHFPEDWVTDIPQDVYVAEVIREKVMRLTRDEVPHDVQVEIVKLAEHEGTFHIEAILHCSRESQKRILIGQGGSMIKAIGSQAREELIESTGQPVVLKTQVAVKKAWRKLRSKQPKGGGKKGKGRGKKRKKDSGGKGSKRPEGAQ